MEPVFRLGVQGGTEVQVTLYGRKWTGRKGIRWKDAKQG